ncbi:MAG: hypothetical protein LAO23_19720 [Acidobacteriia bacterium]|nr:hypothetical protein [Terriglobia bacterium]
MSDYSNIIGSVAGGQQQSAQQGAVSNIDSDPEAAANAISLARASGVPAEVIYANPDAFERNYKSTLASSIVQRNPHIQNYINSNPMAAKVSSDDWGNLDTVSEHAARFGQPSAFSAGWETFKREMSGPVGRWMFKDTEDMEKQLKASPELGALMAVPAIIGAPLEGVLRTGGSVIAGIASGARQLALNYGYDEKSANQLEEFLGVAPLAAGMDFRYVPPELQKLAKDAQRTATKVKPYIDAGIDPPFGLDPNTDKLHVEQSKIDLDNLKEALAAAQKSATRERDPELFTNFIRQHTDATIGIASESVRKLYGDTVPMPDDGLLGFIPGIEDQLIGTTHNGGDIRVPLADWLAKVDPEVAKELHDNIRVRGNGLTLEEAKEGLKLEAKPVVEEPKLEEGQQVEPVDPNQVLVDNVRASAGLEPLSERVGDVASAADDGFEIAPGIKIKPKLTLTQNEQALVGEVNKVFDKMAPRLLGDVPGLPPGVRDVESLSLDGKKNLGLYVQRKEALPFILWTHDTPDAVGTARHEVIHHLYQNGFFSREEWSTLKDAAMSENWMQKYNIHTRYKGAKGGLLLEESIAEGFHNWFRKNFNEETGKWEEPKGPIDKIMMKVGRLYVAIRAAIRDYLGYQPDFNDLFDKVEKGEIGSRRGVEPLHPAAYRSPMAQRPEQPELPGLTRIEDREIFEKASAIGMTVKQYKQVQDLIAKRDAEDTAFAAKQNAKLAEKRMTLEWKDQAKAIRQEIGPDFRNRPDIQADQFLREGVLYGEKIKGRPRLDSTKLTDEQKAKLPKDYMTPGGIHPDDAARLFGYPDTNSLVSRVSDLVAARGELGPREHLNKMIEAEVERRMQAEHGDLAKNILEEAQDHVIGQTQFDLLHEQTLAMATLAGKEMSLSKADVKAMVKQQFDRLLMDGQAVETHLRDSLKAANLAERAYAEQDFAEAFRQQQKQYYSMLMANEAKTLAKAKKKFDRNMKLMSSREVPSVLQEYTNFVHQIMLKIGYGVKRSVQDIQEQIEKSGFKDLEDFWDKKTNPALPDPREMPIAEALMDPKYKKSVDAMTVGEWRGIHESIVTMIHNGRDEKKIIKAGEKADLAQVKKDLIDQLNTLPEKEIRLNISTVQKITKPFRVLGARLLQLEALFNRWDRGDPKGIFNSVFSYPASSAGNEYASLTRKYSKEVLGLKRFEVDLDRPIPNDLFIEPNSIGAPGGEYPMTMTRRNLRAVMLNVGNKSNLDKLARGYNVDPNAVMQWIHRYADKNDWDFAQSVGDIWGKIFDDASKMVESLSGLPPEKLPLEKIQTKFGEYDGWYHKIDYDQSRPGTSKALIGRNPEEQQNYARATTPRSWEKQRTGYAAPISLQLDNLPRLMGQVLRDTAFRPFIHEASKLFYDKDFRMAVNRQYGEEYTSLLVPYLQDLGSTRNVNTRLGATVDKWIEFSRQNAISTLIGMNIHTVYKHGFSAAVNSLAEVGVANFAREFKGLMSADPITGQRNWDFAMQKSEELQRRHQQWTDTLGGAHEEAIEQGGGAVMQARSKAIRWGAAPVAFFDLLSAVPTFLAEYRTQIANGETEGVAIDLGNRAVRRAHGSTAITSRPEAMRGGALGRTLTSLYGFFNQMLQRQYEIGWRAKEAMDAFERKDYEAGLEHIPKIALLVTSSVIAPAVVEEMVSGHFNEKKEGWIERAGKAVLGELSSSLPVIRDVVHALINRQDPSIGLINTPFIELKKLGVDISKGASAFNSQHAGDTVKHFTTVFGMLTGLANAEMGRFLKFAIDTKTGHQRPKGPMDLYRGVTTGTIKEPK